MTSPALLRRSFCVALFSFFASCLLPSAAHAQNSADSAAARALFSEGRQLVAEKRFDEACPKFEESLRLDHGMGTQFNLAFCWEQLGRTASAWALFLDVAAAARAGNQPQRESAARERASALEPKLSRLSIKVAEPLEGMEITRDGQAVGRASWGTALPIDPGNHTLKASAPGKQGWSQDVNVPSGAARISVDVPALTDLPPDQAQATANTAEPREGESRSQPERDRSSGGDGQKIAAWVVGGVGVAALVAGTLFALDFRSERNAADAICVDNPDDCSEADQGSYDSHKENAIKARTRAYVGFGVAGAALITSAILFVTLPSGSDSAQAGVEFVPVIGGDTWGASISGRF